MQAKQAICQKCGRFYASSKSICPFCTPRETKRPELRTIQSPELLRKNQKKFFTFALPKGVSDERKQILGFGGSALMFLGAFMPAIGVPLLGSISYFNNGKGDGVLILFLAAFAFLFTLLKRYHLVIAMGFVSTILMTFSIFEIKGRLGNATSYVDQTLRDNPFRHLAENVLDSVQFQWGWAIMIIGAVMLMGIVFIKPKSPISEKQGSS